MRQRVLSRFSKAPNSGFTGFVNRSQRIRAAVSRMAGNESSSRSSGS